MRCLKGRYLWKCRYLWKLFFLSQKSKTNAEKWSRFMWLASPEICRDILYLAVLYDIQLPKFQGSTSAGDIPHYLYKLVRFFSHYFELVCVTQWISRHLKDPYIWIGDLFMYKNGTLSFSIFLQMFYQKIDLSIYKTIKLNQ